MPDQDPYSTQHSRVEYLRYDETENITMSRWDVYRKCSHEELEETLRLAVFDFLDTDEGVKVVRDLGGEFTWEDAVECIPREWWEKYGIYFVLDPRHPPRLHLNGRQSLYPTNKEKQE